MATRKSLTAAFETLRQFALAFPGTKEEHPWGHCAIKVKGKIFVTLTNDDGALKVSTKLPHSNEAALHFPFTEPTHYGLGKSGWVSSHFAPGGEKPPVEILQAWINESYRAIAPKTLLKALDQGPSRGAGEPGKKRVAARATKRTKTGRSKS